MKKEPSSCASTKLKSCRYSNEKLISSLLPIWAIGIDFGLLALIFLRGMRLQKLRFKIPSQAIKRYDRPPAFWLGVKPGRFRVGSIHQPNG